MCTCLRWCAKQRRSVFDDVLVSVVCLCLSEVGARGKFVPVSYLHGAGSRLERAVRVDAQLCTTNQSSLDRTSACTRLVRNPCLFLGYVPRTDTSSAKQKLRIKETVSEASLLSFLLHHQHHPSLPPLLFSNILSERSPGDLSLFHPSFRLPLHPHLSPPFFFFLSLSLFFNNGEARSFRDVRGLERPQ